MVRVISVCSGKGGVGKTTVASNLAMALRKMNNRVVLLDFNFTTPHLSLHFDLFSHPLTLNNFLRKEIDLESTVFEHDSGLSIVPTSLDLIDIVNVNTDNLRGEIRGGFWYYDYVIIDSAPGLGKEALISLKVSDEVLFVVNPQIPSLVDVAKASKVLTSLENKPKILGVVINKIKNEKYEASLEEIKDFLEMPLLGIISDNKKFLENENKKITLLLGSVKSKAAKEFYNLASNVSGTKHESGFLNSIKVSLDV